MDARQQRGAAIVAKAADSIHRVHMYEYRIPSAREPGLRYRVKVPGGGGGKRKHWRCTCADFRDTTIPCKHIWAVRILLSVITEEPPIVPEPVEVIAEEPEMSPRIVCKYCQGEDLTKYGRCGRRQAYWCKKCKRKFVQDDGFKRLKGDAKVICLVLDLYFKGVSLRGIADTLEQFFGVKVGHVTVYNWLSRYVRLLNDYAEDLRPKVGTTRWHADEMKVKYAGEWKWLWHVVDRKTRFILVSRISEGRETSDATMVFALAKRQAAGEMPSTIVTDGLPAYLDAAKRVFGTGKKRERRHLREIHITDHARNNNMVERVNNTVRGRQRAARTLQSPGGPLTAGQAVWLNFVRPHQALAGQTPAEAAGLISRSGWKNRWGALMREALRPEKSAPTPAMAEDFGWPAVTRQTRLD
ncbi:MAG: DDE-type integrase/transposase/recombinase [Euryarchaeota archaeon]|nr:DDE-type integrase/transposase/recombinase [Euryarchaeota archaeon]